MNLIPFSLSILLALGTSCGAEVCAYDFDIVTIGQSTEERDSGPQSHIADCFSLTSLNLTLNVTSIRVAKGDYFHLYTRMQEALKSEPHFIFIDHTVTGGRALGAMVETNPFYRNGTVIITQNFEDSDFYWCCLTSYFGNVITEDNSTGLVPTSLPVALHGALPFESWLGLARRKAQTVLDVIQVQAWKQFLILYEFDFEEQVRVMADMASRLFLKVQLCNTADTELLQKNILQYFETSVDFQAVLITSYSTAQDILRMTLNLEKLLGKRISVTGKSKWLVFSQTGYVSRHSWLMNSQYDNVAIICDPSDLRRGLRIQTSAYDMLAITTLLYKSYGRQLSFVGTVDQAWNLQLTSDVFPNVKFGFNGRRFIVTTNMWAPYVYRREVNGTFEYYGFCIDLANELSRTLNFSIAFTEPPDGGWGAEIPNSNGSWTGMVGQVVRQEVDMVIAPIGVTGARERVVDFTFAFFYDDSAVIMKKPDPEKSKWRTYIDIFRQEVLMCIAAALILGAVVIMALEKAVTFVYIPSPRVFAKTYAGSFWYLMGAMLNQGGRDLPTSLAGRMFISSWWLFCLVVAGTYSGNLIAVLTVSKDKPPFDTLEEMANQDEYRFGTLGNSMWTTLFETSPRPEFQAIHHKIQGYAAKDPNVLHQDPDVHLSLVKQGGYAYIADKGLFQNWLAYNCDLMLLKEKFFPSKYAIVLPNNSVYTKMISDQVVKIYESGLLQVWIKTWWPKRSFCGGSLVTEARTLTLIDVQSTFYLLGIGFVIGGLILGLELMMDKLRLYRNYRAHAGKRH